MKMAWKRAEITRSDWRKQPQSVSCCTNYLCSLSCICVHTTQTAPDSVGDIQWILISFSSNLKLSGLPVYYGYLLMIKCSVKTKTAAIIRYIFSLYRFQQIGSRSDKTKMIRQDPFLQHCLQVLIANRYSVTVTISGSGRVWTFFAGSGPKILYVGTV